MYVAPEGACRYAIDPAVGLALVRITGAVTGADIARCARALQADPRWTPDLAVVWDERGITSLDVTPEGLKKMVEAQTRHATGPDFIVTEREDHEILLRLYAWRVQARGRPAQVFASLEQALAALGLDALPAALRDL